MPAETDELQPILGEVVLEGVPIRVLRRLQVAMACYQGAAQVAQAVQAQVSALNAKLIDQLTQVAELHGFQVPVDPQVSLDPDKRTITIKATRSQLSPEPGTQERPSGGQEHGIERLARPTRPATTHASRNGSGERDNS